MRAPVSGEPGPRRIENVGQVTRHIRRSPLSSGMGAGIGLHGEGHKRDLPKINVLQEAAAPWVSAFTAR